MRKNIYKKFILPAILALSLVSGNLFIPVHAAITVIETNPLLLKAAVVTSNATAITSTAAVQETAQTIFEWGQTFVLEELKKRILDMLVDQIVSWVQGGGDPKFVTDWGAFLADVGNQAAGDFANELGLGFLCSPFSAQVRLALSPGRKFAQRAQCTLDQIVGNIQSFYDDFRNGGWIAYNESWQPQNNYYGSVLMAWQERDNRSERAQAAAQSEAVAGGGFLSVKDENGRITTPGSVVGSLVNKAVGSDIDYIVNAKQLQAYIGEIADALVNRLIREGATGLAGLGTPKAPKTGSVPSTQRGPCAGLSGATLQSCLNYNSAAGNSFTTARSNILTQINQTLTPRLDAGNIINSSIATLQKYIDDLNKNYTDLFTKQKTVSFEAVCSKTKNELQQELLNEIDKEELTLNRIRQDLNGNQTIASSLQLAKNQIETIPQNDWGSLTVAIDNVRGEINPSGAEDFRSAAQAENSDIKTRTTDSLNSFNNQLTKCYQ